MCFYSYDKYFCIYIYNMHGYTCHPVIHIAKMQIGRGPFASLLTVKRFGLETEIV